MGCLGFELVHFQGLLLEASGDLFFHYSVRELTLSSPFTLKPNRPQAVFPLTVGVNHEARIAGIRRFIVWRQISSLHVFQYQDLVVFFFKEIFTIDISVPVDDTISVKEYNKISKQKDLEIEIENIWHLKTTIVPIIVGAPGMIMLYRGKEEIIIIIIISCHRHGYPWPFLATSPYRSSLPAGPQGYTPYPQRAAECRF